MGPRQSLFQLQLPTDVSVSVGCEAKPWFRFESEWEVIIIPVPIIGAYNNYREEDTKPQQSDLSVSALVEENLGGIFETCFRRDLSILILFVWKIEANVDKRRRWTGWHVTYCTSGSTIRLQQRADQLYFTNRSLVRVAVVVGHAVRIWKLGPVPSLRYFTYISKRHGNVFKYARDVRSKP